MTLVFYISAAIAVLATILVLTRSNAVHALLYLVVSLLAVALAFFSLGAPFVAALEVIIYAGAIIVLFIFVVMLLNLGAAAEKQEREWLKGTSWIGPGILSFILALELIYVFRLQGAGLEAQRIVGPRQVGATLYGPYVLGVELASMLLLAGLVGAYHIGRRSGGGKGGE
ncbi:MAG: NADH-quinone oxidoreductase subunit J [Acidobacteriota bacterium]